MARAASACLRPFPTSPPSYRPAVLPRLRHLWVDGAYQGGGKDGVEQTRGWTVAVVKRPARWVWVGPGQEPPEVPRGLVVLPRRWVVERTFGWLGRWRRTSKDDESLPQTSERVIYLAMIRIMLRRLAETEARSLFRHPLVTRKAANCGSRGTLTAHAS